MATKYIKYDTVTGKKLIGTIMSDISAKLADISVSHVYDAGTDTITLDLKRREDYGLLNDSTGYEVWVDSEYIYRMLNSKIYGSTDMLQEHLSSSLTPVACDYIVTSSLSNFDKVIHGDDDYYFLVRVEGSWSKHTGDNSQGYDFTSTDLYIQLLTSIYNNDSTTVIHDQGSTNFDTPTKVWSKKLTYVSGDTLTLDETFIIELPSAIYACVNFSLDNDTTFDDDCSAIANHSRFFKRVTVKKYPKTSWFKRYSLVADGPNGTSLKTALLPVDSSEGLPFVGFYEVTVRAKVLEEVTVGGAKANLSTSQTLKIRAKGDIAWNELDRSVTHVEYSVGVDYVANYSLQGTFILSITDADIADRKVEYEINLPNGSQKTLESGYMHIKYLGTPEGISRV